MSEDWGPWIEHDGAEPVIPKGYSGAVCEAICKGLGIVPGTVLTPRWPGFYWRWREVRVGWFATEWRRVCDDPAYAPILRYRFARPPRQEAMTRLSQIARGVRPVDGPECPVRVREDAR